MRTNDKTDPTGEREYKRTMEATTSSKVIEYACIETIRETKES